MRENIEALAGQRFGGDKVLYRWMYFEVTQLITALPIFQLDEAF